MQACIARAPCQPEATLELTGRGINPRKWLSKLPPPWGCLLRSKFGTRPYNAGRHDHNPNIVFQNGFRFCGAASRCSSGSSNGAEETLRPSCSFSRYSRAAFLPPLTHNIFSGSWYPSMMVDQSQLHHPPDVQHFPEPGKPSSPGAARRNFLPLFLAATEHLK